MPVGQGPLQTPPQEYSRKDEIQFRRDLESRLADIIAELRMLNPGLSPQGSLVSKRESMLSVPVGIQEYS